MRMLSSSASIYYHLLVHAEQAGEIAISRLAHETPKTLLIFEYLPLLRARTEFCGEYVYEKLPGQLFNSMRLLDPFMGMNAPANETSVSLWMNVLSQEKGTF